VRLTKHVVAPIILLLVPNVLDGVVGAALTVIPHMHAAVSRTGHEPPEGGLESPYAAVVPDESLGYGCTTPACESVSIHNDNDNNNNKRFSNKKNRTQGARTSEPLEVIDNNGEVVFAITVTTHK
jgi:hypothetical protein